MNFSTSLCNFFGGRPHRQLPPPLSALRRPPFPSVQTSFMDDPIVIHSNFLSGMHGYELILKVDITLSWFRRQGALQTIIHDGFWKSDHDFLIVFHSNFLAEMHGFRFNELILPAEYDVIMVSPLGGASADFLWRILNEQPLLPDSDQ